MSEKKTKIWTLDKMHINLPTQEKKMLNQIKKKRIGGKIDITSAMDNIYILLLLSIWVMMDVAGRYVHSTSRENKKLIVGPSI